MYAGERASHWRPVRYDELLPSESECFSQTLVNPVEMGALTSTWYATSSASPKARRLSSAVRELNEESVLPTVVLRLQSDIAACDLYIEEY